MEINAAVKSIRSLKEYYFVVPEYQREYVWESDKQVSRFLQDINLGKYGNFDDRPAKIQAEMRAAKIENRPINFKV